LLCPCALKYNVTHQTMIKIVDLNARGGAILN
jgi:hypothetical protein